MKLLRYGAPGHERPGILGPDGRLRDLSHDVWDLSGEALRPALLARLSALDPAMLPEVPGTPRIAPCVGGVGKIVGVGLNYRDHAAESGMAIPKEPPLFLEPTSAIIGPNEDVEIPPGSEKTDWEVELGVVIGKPGKYLKQEQALEHVSGYCVVNDVSEPAWQLERGGQWDKG